MAKLSTTQLLVVVGSGWCTV